MRASLSEADRYYFDTCYEPADYQRDDDYALKEWRRDVPLKCTTAARAVANGRVLQAETRSQDKTWTGWIGDTRYEFRIPGGVGLCTRRSSDAEMKETVAFHSTALCLCQTWQQQ